MQNHLKIAFWLALAFAVTMAVLPHPPQVMGSSSDKVQHMTAFGVLTFLGTLAYPQLPTLRLAVGLIALGAAIEIVQAIPFLHRDAEWADLGADAIAVLVVAALARWVASRIRPHA